MMDSQDSNLFGNNDHRNDHRSDHGNNHNGAHENELYSDLYRDPGRDLHVQPAGTRTHATEPLFPDAPTVSQNWAEITPVSIPYAYSGKNTSNAANNHAANNHDSNNHDANDLNGTSYNGNGHSTPRLKGAFYPGAMPDDSVQNGTVHNETARNGTDAAVPKSMLVSPTDSPTDAAPDAATSPVAAVPTGEWASPKLIQPATRPVTSHHPVMSEHDIPYNRHFAVLMDMMQHGAWPQALAKIQAMRAEYPGVRALDNLLEEATLKAELMAHWTPKIKGRRLTVGQEWLIRRSLPFLVLFALFVSSALFYRTYVAPSRQVVAMERANNALVDEATSLLQVGQIDQAIALYNEVLQRDASHSIAQQGLTEASRLAELAVTYDVAIRVANSGNLERSLRMLQSIKAKSPTFRDIDARLTRVNTLLVAEEAFQQAERAFAQRRWLDAITAYERTKLLASDYQAVHVGVQLSLAYTRASQKLVAQWPTPEFGTELMRDLMRRALEVNGSNDGISAFLAQLDDFIKGERALNNGNVGQAVQAWRELYEAQPTFLGGYLAEQLYRAYLTLAAETRAADAEYARELYTQAAALPVYDSSEAHAQLQLLGQ